jgi:hypothetical protein
VLGVALLVASLVTQPSVARAFSTDIHTRITNEALSFMTSPQLGIIVDGNHDEDQGDAEDLAERHAQNCRFRDSAAYINMRYGQVVEALRQPLSNDPGRAARLFGHILHGLQDFYSHSNLIPTPPDGLGLRGRLLDTGLGLWPLPKPYSRWFDDIVFIEGNPPAGTRVLLPIDGNGRVNSAVPIVTQTGVQQPRAQAELTLASAPSAVARRTFRGLMTSGAPRHEGDQVCPPVGTNCNANTARDVCIRHGDKRSSDTSARTFDGAGRLNLDGEGGGDWLEARRHATLQTQHEWCRLLHLSRALDPSWVAAGRVLGNWVGTDSGAVTPHIRGTACQRGAARHHLVEISATVSQSNPWIPFYPWLPFLVFRSDFTSSARALFSGPGTQTLRICGDTNETIVATLVPSSGAGVVLPVTVPAVARRWTETRPERGGVTFSINVTPNAC